MKQGHRLSAHRADHAPQSCGCSTPAEHGAPVVTPTQTRAGSAHRVGTPEGVARLGGHPGLKQDAGSVLTHHLHAFNPRPVVASQSEQDVSHRDEIHTMYVAGPNTEPHPRQGLNPLFLCLHVVPLGTGPARLSLCSLSTQHSTHGTLTEVTGDH